MENDYVWNLIAKKLSGEASPEDLLELENQLRINPELHYSMQTVIDMWVPSNDFDREQAHEAFNKHTDRMQKLGIGFSSVDINTNNSPTLLSDTFIQNKSSKKLLWLAATLLIIIAGLFFSIKFNNPSSANKPAKEYVYQASEKTTSEISTRNGSKTNVILPDGTKVWLNAGSKLTYDKNYGTTIREVNLTGEAFFDVVHNAEKPFVIHASSISIKVLGTKFNVKSYPSDKTTEATLIRGSIEVSFKNRPTEKIILKPSEKIVVSNDDNDAVIKPTTLKIEQSHTPEPIVAVRNMTYYQQSNDVVETSWVENKLIFQDESFEDLAKQFERWYGVTINFATPELKQLYFTGNFKNESVIQALNALKISNNFNYTTEGNNITILK